MKPTLACALALGALLAGCGEKSGSPGTTKRSDTGNPAAAPGDYLKSTAKSQKIAVKTINTAALNKAIELFYVQEGRYPKDLDELVGKKLIAEIPEAPAGMKIVYDGRLGVVTVEKE
jgi:hypothetical protein